MAYLEDKIQQVQDKELRDILLAEVKKLKKEKKFGLVFEEHVPELVPVYSAPIRPRSTVALKDGDLLETFRVKRIKDGQATVTQDSDGKECVYPVGQLVVVQRFGEAIYPALELNGMVQNGGDRPFHTLIEADNYHALQLLEYLYAGQVDCIYIDPPYNTGAKDWKYNNNYVDSNDSWRHSKWLTFIDKRLKLAKQLLSAHDSTQYGSRMISDILPDRSFPFPKSLYAVRDTLRFFVEAKPNALIVDFFAGSGTTLNAVNLINAADGGNRRCILVTNNEVSADETKTLQEQGFMPGDGEYEKHGICQSVTWPRSKYTIRGKRDDGTLLEGDYLTGRTITKDKRRTFKQIGFIDSQQLTATRKKELVSLLDGIPKSKLDKDASFFVEVDCKASVLFDETEADAYLEALDDMTHIETFYLVTTNNSLFKHLKDTINEMLDPLQVSEEEKRPMSAGFEANLAYFKLDFLDANEVQLGRKFELIRVDGNHIKRLDVNDNHNRPKVLNVNSNQHLDQLFAEL